MLDWRFYYFFFTGSFFINKIKSDFRLKTDSLNGVVCRIVKNIKIKKYVSPGIDNYIYFFIFILSFSFIGCTWKHSLPWLFGSATCGVERRHFCLWETFWCSGEGDVLSPDYPLNSSVAKRLAKKSPKSIFFNKKVLNIVFKKCSFLWINLGIFTSNLYVKATS